MKLPLSNGEFAIIDDDLAHLLKWKWQRDITGYPSRGGSTSGKKEHLRLHTIIMGKAPKGFVTDHVNGDKLDNRRQNLRFCSWRLNNLNKQRASGVSWHAQTKAWRVRFTVLGKELQYGSFNNKEDAERIAAFLKASLICYELTKGANRGV